MERAFFTPSAYTSISNPSGNWILSTGNLEDLNSLGPGGLILPQLKASRGIRTKMGSNRMSFFRGNRFPASRVGKQPPVYTTLLTAFTGLQFPPAGWPLAALRIWHGDSAFPSCHALSRKGGRRQCHGLSKIHKCAWHGLLTA